MAVQEGRNKGALPRYTKPPVIEVVLGAQFEALRGLMTPHYGLFWQLVREEYPDVEDKTPLAEIFEDRPAPGPALELVELPPQRRVFFIHHEKNFLLQLQPTRFLHNWRKVKEEDSYPTFAIAEERFRNYWSLFTRFVAEHKLGGLQVNQYELTYINHIVEGEGAFPLAIPKYLAAFNWQSDRAAPFLPEPGSLAINIRFKLPENKGALHVSLKHGKRLADAMDVLVLELTARGPAKSDASDMGGWFSVAHEWIVKGFTDLTTDVAHRVWERFQ
jgi:uncharacterized protein (TIGR04255 family)